MTTYASSIGGTSNSPFTGAQASGTDWLTGVKFGGGIVASAWVSGAWTTAKPMLLTSHNVNFRSGGSGTVFQKISTSASGGSGSTSDVSRDPDNDLTPVWYPDKLITDGTQYYAGFRMDNGTSVLFYRQSGAGANLTTDNQIYKDGTAQSTYSGTSMYQSFGWATVPSAPTNPLFNSAGPRSVTLTFTPATDVATDNVFGYRVFYKKSSNTDWLSTDVLSPTDGTFLTVTGLTPNTSYDFRISAVNNVTEAWLASGTTYTTVSNYSGASTATVTGSTLANGVWTGSAFSPALTYVCTSTSPVTWSLATVKVWDGTAWQTSF